MLYGVAQYKLGKIQNSSATFKKAIKKFTKSADLRNYYGELLMDQRKFEDALDEFDQAIKIAPSNPLAYVNKALGIYQLKQDLDGAEELCRKAVEGK